MHWVIDNKIVPPDKQVTKLVAKRGMLLYSALAIIVLEYRTDFAGKLILIFSIL